MLPKKLFKLENYVLILHVFYALFLQLSFKLFGFSLKFFKDAKVDKGTLNLWMLCCRDTREIKSLLAVALLILLAIHRCYELLFVFINFFLKSFMLLFVFICFVDKFIHLKIVTHFKSTLFTVMYFITRVCLRYTLGRIRPGSMRWRPVWKDYCFLISYPLNIVLPDLILCLNTELFGHLWFGDLADSDLICILSLFNEKAVNFLF